jgi:hypothetical protein
MFKILLLSLIANSTTLAMDGEPKAKLSLPADYDPDGSDDDYEDDTDDIEMSSKPVGLTVKNGIDFLLHRAEKKLLDSFDYVVFALTTSGVLLLIPGFMPGAVISIIGCIDNFYSGVCYAGLALNALPLAAAIVGLPINAIWGVRKNSQNKKFNKNLHDRITNEFVKGRDEAELLVKEDIEYLGYDLIMKMITFKRIGLSPHQALWVAEQNLADYKRRIGYPHAFYPFLSQTGDILGFKLLQFLELKSPDLIETLKNPDTRKLFLNEPELLQSLVRCLKKEERLDEALEKQLDDINALIKGPKKEKPSVSDPAIIASADDLQMVTSSGKRFSLNKKDLLRISKKLAALDEDVGIEEELFVEKNWTDEDIAMLVEFAQQQKIKLDGASIFSALKLGHGFMVIGLITACDVWLVEKGISTDLIGRWLKEFDLNEQDKMLTHESFQARWRFCDYFQLRHYKRQLLKPIGERLRNLHREIYNFDIFDHLRALKDSDWRDLLFFYGAEVFHSQLAMPQFLVLAWERMKNISLLREEIISFCQNPQNKNTITAAWINMPPDLQEALRNE